MDKTLQRVLNELEEVLREQLAANERMLALMNQKREAMARAQPAALADLLKEENACVQLLSELEKRRLAMAATLTTLVMPTAKEPMRLPDLAAQLPEPARGRLLTLRHQVRERMEQVRKQVRVASQAAEALLRHMQGLIQSVGGVVSQVPTYNRVGARPQAAMAVSTFNTTA